MWLTHATCNTNGVTAIGQQITGKFTPKLQIFMSRRLNVLFLIPSAIDMHWLKYILNDVQLLQLRYAISKTHFWAVHFPSLPSCIVHLSPADRPTKYYTCCRAIRSNQWAFQLFPLFREVPKLTRRLRLSFLNQNAQINTTQQTKQYSHLIVSKRVWWVKKSEIINTTIFLFLTKNFRKPEISCHI